MPVGTILPYIGSLADIPKGWHLCDGTESTPNLLDNRFLEGDATVWIYKEPGLPNATGSLTVSDKNHMYWHVTGSGVFTAINHVSTGSLPIDSYKSGVSTLIFSLSSSNPIYGNSSTVQPRSYTVMYIMKIK